MNNSDGSPSELKAMLPRDMSVLCTRNFLVVSSITGKWSFSVGCYCVCMYVTIVTDKGTVFSTMQKFVVSVPVLRCTDLWGEPLPYSA